MSISDIANRISMLADWICGANHMVVFTGAGISTDSGIPDYRGQDGLWTRQERGLPASKMIEWEKAEPNKNHYAVTELYQMGKLDFLITQNVDNLHLRAGIPQEVIAELHGNIFKLKCIKCETKWDYFADMDICPNCEGKLVFSVVNFGDPMPVHEMKQSGWHSSNCDLFLVVGSSLVVRPAADMPQMALRNNAKLVIINQGTTAFDGKCHLRFEERISDVLPEVVSRLKYLLQNKRQE